MRGKVKMGRTTKSILWVVAMWGLIAIILTWKGGTQVLPGNSESEIAITSMEDLDVSYGVVEEE